MSRGKHARPSPLPRYAHNTARAAIPSVAGLALLAQPVGNALADATPAEWAAIIHCESGGNPEAENPTSTASGLFQIIDGTWAANGGVSDYGVTHASDATPEQQLAVANRIYDRAGGFRDWNVSKSCWGPLMAQGFTAPLPATEPIDVPAAPVEPPPPPAEPAAPTDTIDVVSGDTVSTIAIHKLGLPAWEPFYEANTDVIGVNPNLIFPGQRLRVGGLTLPGGPPVQVEVEPQALPAEPEAPAPPPVQQEAAEQVGADLPQAIITNSAGPVSGRAQDAANRVWANVPGSAFLTIGGTRSSARDMAGHPSGNALDYMVGGDSALGDAIAQYHIDHWDELGVDYLIWQQRIKYSAGGAWEWMEDRGSVTQNHWDHVHTNYNR